MIKHNQQGSVNVLLLPLIISVSLLVIFLAFGAWAFSSRQSYKNDSDQKVAVAVDQAKSAQSATDAKQYSEAAKSPLKTYTGPEQYGKVSFQYPKTWSGYVDASGNGSSAPLDGYFNPDVVPSVNDQNSTFALRVQVVAQSYDTVVQQFSNQQGVTVAPFRLAKVPSVVGVEVQGQIEQDKQGIMIILPVRDKTLEVYTESTAFTGDFNNTILPNLTFVP